MRQVHLLSFRSFFYVVMFKKINDFQEFFVKKKEFLYLVHFSRTPMLIQGKLERTETNLTFFRPILPPVCSKAQVSPVRKDHVYASLLRP